MLVALARLFLDGDALYVTEFDSLYILVLLLVVEPVVDVVGEVVSVGESDID